MSKETVADVLELAARVEAASGPDRELDGEIAAILRLNPPWAGQRSPHFERCTWTDGRDSWDAPQFTASLDAAMSLVGDASGSSLVATLGGRWSALLYTENVMGSGASRSAALCAAALKARAGEGSGL